MQGGGGSSFTNFLALLDTPGSYNAQAGKVPIVNSGESALIFDNESLINLKDVNNDGLADNMVLFYDFNDGQQFKPQYRMYWRDKWAPGIYKTHEVVSDQGWTLIANKETSERAAPQPTSQSSFQLPDSPTWTPGTSSPVAVQGLRFQIGSELLTLDGYRFWRATNTGDESYHYIIEDITDPANVTLLGSGSLPQGPIGWVEVFLTGTFYFLGQIIDIRFQTEVSTGSSSWIHTWTLQDAAAGLPASGTYTRAADFSTLRFNINADGPVDVKTDLDLLKIGDEILLVEDGQSSRFNTYIVSATPTYSNGDTVLECPVSRVGNGTTVRTGFLCEATATIKSGVLPADYVSIPNFWFLNPPVTGAVVNGYLTTSVDEVPTLNDDAFGIDIRGHAWTTSDDWDVITTTLGGGGSGGGGGGSDDFLGLIDTPSTYSGQGSKLVAVAVDETKLEFIDPGAGGGGVDSVFGRVGTVVAQTGDYSSSQVGADTSAEVDAKDVAAIAAHVALPDPHTQYLTANELPSLAISYLTGVTSGLDGAYLVTAVVTLGNVENSVVGTIGVDDTPELISQYLRDPVFPDPGTLLETGSKITLDMEPSTAFLDIQIEFGVRRAIGPTFDILGTNTYPTSEGRGTVTFDVPIPETSYLTGDTSFMRLYVIKRSGAPGGNVSITIYQEGSYISRALTDIPIASIPGPHAETHEVGGNDQVDHDLLLNANGFNSHATLDAEQVTQDAAISQNTNDILPLQQNIPPTDGQVAGRYLRVTQSGVGTFTITDGGSYNTNGTFRFTQQSTNGSGSEYLGEATVSALVLTGISLVRNVGGGYAVSELITLDIPGASENVPAIIQVDTLVPGQVWETVVFPPSDVTSWNSRTGDVVPEPSDYNADEIDDAATVKKFATQTQLDQIGTNTTNIGNNTTAIDGKEPTVTATTSADIYQGDKTFVPKSGLPISTATQTALDLKEDDITATTTADYYQGDKTFQPKLGLPISTATQTALDGKQDAGSLAANRAMVTDGSGNQSVSTTTDTEIGFVDGVTSAIQPQIDSKEPTVTATTIADYYQGDKTFQPKSGLPISTATQTALDLKEDDITATTSADVFQGDKTFVPKSGLPISTATQTALDLKEDDITATTTADYYRGDKSFVTLNKAAVGLGNVDNTSDALKPVSDATQTALDLKEPTLPLTTRGDVLVRNAANATARLPIGTATHVLTSDGTDVSWAPGGGGGGGSPPDSEVVIYTGNNFGSTNLKIRRFLTTSINTGGGITYADSATLGATFTINADGIYSIIYTDWHDGATGKPIGLSLNSTQLTTNIQSIALADILQLTVSNDAGTASLTKRLVAGDVIRAHTDGTQNDQFFSPYLGGVRFHITQVFKL